MTVIAGWERCCFPWPNQSRSGPAAGPALSSEEPIKEVVERAAAALVIIPLTTGRTAPVRVLDGGLGIDIHHARLKLLGDLRKLVGELLRRRHRQRRCVGTLFVFLAFDVVRDDSPDQDSDR